MAYRGRGNEMTNRKTLTGAELDRITKIALADPNLSITADSVDFCRKLADEYERKAEAAGEAAKSCRPASRGGHMAHRSMALKARERMLENADFQLKWLRRFRPGLYKEIMK